MILSTNWDKRTGSAQPTICTRLYAGFSAEFIYKGACARIGASTARFRLYKKNRHLCKIEMESKGSYSGLGFGRISSSADDSQWLCNLFVGVTTLVTVIKKCQQERIKGVCTTISTGIWNAHARWAYNASHVHRVVQCVSCKGLDDFHTRPRRHSVENLVSRNGDVCAIKRIRRRSSLKTNTKSQNIYVY